MKNLTTTTFLSVRSAAILFLTSASVFMVGCQEKAWEGKFVAPRHNNCYLLEYVKIYPDKTADVKYEALQEEANFEAMYDEKDKILYIRELNKEWAFRLSNDTLFEISNLDPYCFLVKEKK